MCAATYLFLALLLTLLGLVSTDGWAWMPFLYMYWPVSWLLYFIGAYLGDSLEALLGSFGTVLANLFLIIGNLFVGTAWWYYLTKFVVYVLSRTIDPRAADGSERRLSDLLPGILVVAAGLAALAAACLGLHRVAGGP